MRKQYHFWPAASGSGLLDAWDVDRLIVHSAELPVEQVLVASIPEIDTDYWTDFSAAGQTVRKIVGHARAILAVDPGYPIILGHDGRVMDGMHRVARALLEGRSEIAGRRFPDPLPPDFRDVRPADLSYERH